MNGEGEAQAGKDWTQSQIDLIVSDYFEMVRLVVQGIPFVKTRRYERIQAITGRTGKSVEWKLRNVSAVAELLGVPPVPGLAPARHFQDSLVEAVHDWLNANGWPVSDAVEANLIDQSSSRSLDWTAIPKDFDRRSYERVAAKRIARKFDAAATDAKNRALGYHGEEAVFLSEMAKLKALGRADLAKKVDWVSQSQGDGLGYDILSFDGAGNKRLLEVKTTGGWEGTPFFISENERSFAEENPQEFRLVRVYDFLKAPKAFELQPPLESLLSLKATTYRASLL